MLFIPAVQSFRIFRFEENTADTEHASHLGSLIKFLTEVTLLIACDDCRKLRARCFPNVRI